LRFYFCLARELGKTVEELLDGISSEEITYWQALFALENEEREWDRIKQGGRE